MAAVGMELCPTHGSNKIPRRAVWWFQQDVLEKRIFDLSMEYLCMAVRGLSVSTRQGIQNAFGSAWQKQGSYTVWQEVWDWVPPAWRPQLIEDTFRVNSEFARSVLAGAYASTLAVVRDLEQMD
ncbi:unnamed protein product [Symbiodinium sp. CCMP2592]|nr:unnamed protein product [Symbiodinium sp. CCMP2592]